MYGYGYPYGFYFDPTYVLLIIGMILALAASGKMRSTFARYQQVRSHSGLTGAQTAQRILNAAGIYDVTVVPIAGSLTDHYDPRTKKLALSQDVYGRTSVAAVCVAIASIVLRYTALGTYIQSVGINKKASRIAGFNSAKIILMCYAICGLCAGLAGMVATSRIYSADTNNIGLNMELDAILSVALGGNSLGGGKFSLAGSIIGAYTIQAITTTLYALGVSSAQAPVFKAIVVIIIVVIQAEPAKAFFKKLTKKSGKEAARA